MFTSRNLQNTLLNLGLSPDESLFTQLEAAYTEKTRYYHTGRHISQCLRQFQKNQDLAVFPHEIEFSIWFHDVIYDTHRADNEEKSAAIAVDYLKQHQLSADIVHRVEQMIIATKTHNPSTPDCALLIDVDLSILGTKPETFEYFDSQIRKEYEWVPDADFRQGRIAVLKSFLDRASIFHTEYFCHKYEKQAKQNLLRKINELTTQY